MIQGLRDHQVLQRGGVDGCDPTLTVTTEQKGTLSVRVSEDGKTLPDFENRSLGTLEYGTHPVNLTGIPTGGSYEIVFTFRAEDPVRSISFRARDVLVGDAWVLAGQSNMNG